MSAYSTLHYTPEGARDTLKRFIDECHDNKILERLMDIALDQQLYNCIIIPAAFADQHDKERGQWGNKVIRGN